MIFHGFSNRTKLFLNCSHLGSKCTSQARALSEDSGFTLGKFSWSIRILDSSTAGSKSRGDKQTRSFPWRCKWLIPSVFSSSMAFRKFIESSLCLFVIVAGFFIAVPLRLLEEQTGKTCLLFGQVDFLEKNVTGGNNHYCDLGFYSSVVDIFLGSFLICLRWCCLMKTEKPRWEWYASSRACCY